MLLGGDVSGNKVEEPVEWLHLTGFTVVLITQAESGRLKSSEVELEMCAFKEKPTSRRFSELIFQNSRTTTNKCISLIYYYLIITIRRSTCQN